jgi:hypothetical protein
MKVLYVFLLIHLIVTAYLLAQDGLIVRHNVGDLVLAGSRRFGTMFLSPYLAPFTYSFFVLTIVGILLFILSFFREDLIKFIK